MSAIIHVAVGIIYQQSKILFAKRTKSAMSGYWEFPGGKQENGETIESTLKRELKEELNIEIKHFSRWITVNYQYQHAAVKLYFFRIYQFNGECVGNEGQEIRWQNLDALTISPLLPANIPVLKALSLPDIYAISCAELYPNFFKLLKETCDQGLKILQIREKSLSADDLRDFTKEVLAITTPYSVKIMINSHYDWVLNKRDTGLHLDSTRLQKTTHRPKHQWVGASCHNLAQLKKAAQLSLDYVLLSPVLKTLSHPQQKALGWPAFKHHIEGYSLPVYALGGMRKNMLNTARKNGAHGISLMRDLFK